MLSTNESKLILSCCHRCFLWFKFSEDKHWYSFMPPAFLLQRGCDSLGASTDETYFHADRRHHADVWGNRLPFPPKTKNNFSEIDISQPTPWMSLSVPSFSLARIQQTLVFCNRQVTVLGFNSTVMILLGKCIRLYSQTRLEFRFFSEPHQLFLCYGSQER